MIATFPDLKCPEGGCPCCSCSYWCNPADDCELKDARAEAAKVVAERDRYRKVLVHLLERLGHAGADESGCVCTRCRARKQIAEALR